jgi:hypothetical protein
VRDPGNPSCCCKANQIVGLTIMRQLFRAVRPVALPTLSVSTRRTNEFSRSQAAACPRQIQGEACFVLAGTESRSLVVGWRLVSGITEPDRPLWICHFHSFVPFTSIYYQLKVFMAVQAMWVGVRCFLCFH